MTTTNTYGRQVVLPLTNKSGGGVIAGDVVVIDTTNNDAFTTSTAGAVTGGVGIAQETIASNAIGRVLLSGYAALVNVNASVTRGNFGKTHTVVKQATDAGASRVAGTFCQFLTGGTTPDASVWQPDLGAGSGLTDPMTTRGDVIVRNASNVTGRLAVGASGKDLRSDGTDVSWAYPPSYEFDYAQITSSVNPVATAEASATVVVTGNAVTYDGSTVVKIEFQAPSAEPNQTSGDQLLLYLFDNGSSIGLIGQVAAETATSPKRDPVHLETRITPSNAAHTYGIRATVSSAARQGTVRAGAGGLGNYTPAFIRITKV